MIYGRVQADGSRSPYVVIGPPFTSLTARRIGPGHYELEFTPDFPDGQHPIVLLTAHGRQKGIPCTAGATPHRGRVEVHVFKLGGSAEDSEFDFVIYPPQR